MEYGVLKAFKDKENPAIRYAAGDTFSSQNKKRVTELQTLGFIEKEGSASLLDGTVEQVSKALDGLSPEDLEQLLKEEKENKQRKSVLQQIESLLSKE